MTRFFVRKNFFVFLLFFMLFATVLSERIVATPLLENTLLAKKEKQKGKTERIKTKKQLIKSLDKNLSNMTDEISYKIDKKVVTGIKGFEKIFWNESDKSFVAMNILFKIDSFTSTSYRTSKFFAINIKVNYSLSKSRLKEFAETLKKIEDMPLLKEEEEVKNHFLGNFYDLKKMFFVKLDKDLSKKLNKGDSEFLDLFLDEPKYNDLEKKVRVKWKLSKYSNFDLYEVKLKTKLTKEEADEILAKVSPVITTMDEFLNEIIKRVENLEEDFSINVAKDVINFDNESEADAFWDKLYSMPEYDDFSRHIDNGFYSWNHYKGYFKWKKSNKYDMTREDVTKLKMFVKDWVATNLNSMMTEEEKVRAINDYMVKEYRYTFGNNPNSNAQNMTGTEKIGKYSVYSSLALLNEKGGVCNAKANMFYRLAKEAGLEVLYISGTGNKEAHGWNMIKVDGNWYHLDNTWNRGHYEGTSEYEYFNNRDYYLKGDATMRKDHSWDEAKYPAAPMDYQGYVPMASVILPELNKAA